MLDTFLHWLGFGLCHQLPERSFFAGSHQLPVCARDTGIYLGFVIALALMAALDRGRHRTGMPPVWVLAIGALLVGVMGWDGITSYAGLRATTNDIRLATGLGTGFALTLVIVPLLGEQLWRRRSPERVLGAPWEVAVWLAALPLSFAVVRWGLPALGTAYALIAAAAILVTFSTVNMVLVLLAPRFERKAERLIEATPAALLGLALTAAEVGLTIWLRLGLLALVSGR
jgi:uncharacterized membrane protein